MDIATRRRCYRYYWWCVMLKYTFLMLLFTSLFTDGFPNAGFSVVLPSGKNFSLEMVIDGWQTSRETADVKVAGNTGFEVNVFGIYIIGYVINMRMNQSAPAAKACIQLNDNSGCQTLISQFNSTKSSPFDTMSLHAAGVLKLQSGDFVSVKVVTDSKWQSSIGSTFFGHLIQEYPSFPAFHAYPSSSFEISNGNEQFIKTWNIRDIPGSFTSSVLFSLSRGQFTARRSGFYYVAANVIIEKGADVEKYRLVLLSNENEVNEVETSMSSQITTMTLSTILRIKSGTQILLKIRKAGDTRTKVLRGSSFSITMINNGLENANGLSIQSLHGYSYKSGDKIIKLDVFKQDIFNYMKSRSLKASSDGSYLLCFNFKMKCLFVSRCFITLKIYKRKRQEVALQLQNVIEQNSQREKEMLLSSSIVIKLLKDEEIILDVASNSESLSILNGSVSFLQLNEIYPAQSTRMHSNTKRTHNNWSKITIFNGRSTFWGFPFNSDVNGDHVIHRAGIYHVSANVIVKKRGIAIVTASIVVDNDLSRTDGLTMLHSDAKGSCTLNIASAIRLKRGSRLSVYVKVESDAQWSVDNSSSFSAVFIGNPSLVVGFQTTMFSDVTQRSAGWNTPSNWNRASDITSMPYSFSNNAQFSPIGYYTVAITGIYFASANIIIGNADLIANDSVFIAMISVNWKTSSDLLYVRKTTRFQASKSDAKSDVAFSVSSVLSLQKGDIVAVKVCSKVDPTWTIRKATGFSVVLLSTTSSSLSSGFIALRRQSNPSLASNKAMLSTWSTKGKDHTLFAQGGGLSMNTNGTVKIREEGIYIITVTLGVTMESSHEISLGLFNSKSQHLYPCALNTQLYSSSYVSCFLTLFLQASDVFTPYFQVSKLSGKISIDKACYISAFKVERPVKYPWFYAELERNLNGTGRQKTLSWSTTHSSRLFGHSGSRIHNTSGSFYPARQGHFLVTSNIIFDGTSKGIQNIDMELVSANSTRVSSALRFYTTIRSTALTLSCAILLPLRASGFRWVLLSASGSKINRKSSFSAALLPKLSSSDLTELTLQQDKEFKKPGFSSFSRWVSKPSSNPQMFITSSNSIYFISVILLAKFSSNRTRLFLGVNHADTQLQWTISKTSYSYSTYVLSGILKSSEKGRLSLGLKLERDSFLKLSKLSKAYVAKLGHSTNCIGVMASLKLEDSILQSSDKTKKVWQVRATYSKFINKLMIKDGVFIVGRTGVYVFSLGLSIVSSQNRSVYEVMVRLDGNNLDRMYAKQHIDYNGTISITNSVYLQKGMVLDIAISTTARFTVSPGSSVGIILLQDLDNSMDDILPPVIYKDILPAGRHILPLHIPYALSCYCAADGQILYKWFQNAQLIKSGTEKTLNLKGQVWESGDYHCEAIASSITAISKSVKLEFLGSVGCKVLQKACKSNSKTCIQSTHKCECESGWKLVNGKCKSNGVGRVQNSRGIATGLPVAVVVLGPIAICVVIYFVSLAIYTYWKQRRMLHHQHLCHQSSFVERFQPGVPCEEFEINSIQEYDEDETGETGASNPESGNEDLESEGSCELDENTLRDFDLDYEERSFMSISTM
eukprot:gene3268-3749_t